MSKNDKIELNIYQKIVKVMESIEYLQKDDNVGTGKSSYKAISDEKVKVAVRNAMISEGLVMFRIHVETEESFREYTQYNEQKIQRFTKVKSTYKIVNAQNTEESIEIESIGHGVDSQDKSAGKALTYASKYALLDTFLIPTGMDTDKTHSDDYDTPVNKSKPAPVVNKAVSKPVTKPDNKPATPKPATPKPDIDTDVDEKSQVISKDQAREIFAISNGNNSIIRTIMDRYGYSSTKDILSIHYDNICDEVEVEAKKKK